MIQPPKKKRKAFVKGKLSFGLDDDEEGDSSASVAATPRSQTPDTRTATRDASVDTDDAAIVIKKRGPNTAIGHAPKIMTKSALKVEAETREKLRKEFLVMQEAVKVTDMAIPFVFYDGTNIPGGVCTIKKGEHVWLFLDRARKAGAELGVGGDKGRREWARIGVDDLMLVRGEIIIPHVSLVLRRKMRRKDILTPRLQHYDFYYFIVNKTKGFNGPIFNYSDKPTKLAPPTEQRAEEDYDPLSRPGNKAKSQKNQGPLEGYDHDPNLTKVVDRRWYEKQKHIFPASVWEEFDPKKDYTTGIRKDTEGNAFFFT